MGAARVDFVETRRGVKDKTVLRRLRRRILWSARHRTSGRGKRERPPLQRPLQAGQAGEVVSSAGQEVEQR